MIRSNGFSNILLIDNVFENDIIEDTTVDGIMFECEYDKLHTTMQEILQGNFSAKNKKILEESNVNIWRGYKIHLIKIDIDEKVAPNQEKLKKIYEYTPIIIKEKVEFNPRFWIYMQSSAGEAELLPLYRFFIRYLKNVKFEETPILWDNPPEIAVERLPRKVSKKNKIINLLNKRENHRTLFRMIKDKSIQLQPNVLNYLVSSFLELVSNDKIEKEEDLNIILFFLENSKDLCLDPCHFDMLNLFINNNIDLFKNNRKQLTKYLLDVNVDQRIKAKLFIKIKQDKGINFIKLLRDHTGHNPDSEKAAERILLQEQLYDITDLDNRIELLLSLEEQDKEYFINLFDDCSRENLVKKNITDPVYIELKNNRIPNSLFNFINETNRGSGELNSKKNVICYVLENLVFALNSDEINIETKRKLFFGLHPDKKVLFDANKVLDFKRNNIDELQKDKKFSKISLKKIEYSKKTNLINQEYVIQRQPINNEKIAISKREKCKKKIKQLSDCLNPNSEGFTNTFLSFVCLATTILTNVFYIVLYLIDN